MAEAEHAEALREADRLKDIVLASVSHDLRTPLTTIKALAQSEAMQGNESAAAIEEQADRLTRLVSDLLDLSRLKGGGFTATPELNTAEDLIGAAVRQTRGLFGGRPLRTVIDLESPRSVGIFDFSQSLRVLCNFLENAARYSPPSEPIELSARREARSSCSPCRTADRAWRRTIARGSSSRSIDRPVRRRTRGARGARAVDRAHARGHPGRIGELLAPAGRRHRVRLRLPASELRADALEPIEQTA